VALAHRLASIASFYNNEESIYDIGCDHGLLGLHFQNYPLIKNIHLIDPNPYSVELIKKDKDSYITEREKLIFKRESGEKIKITESNSLVFIAGMGGKTIIEILSEWDEQNFQNCSQIVLSPHRDHLKLREYLKNKGMKLVGETVIYDQERYYEILSVGLKGESEVGLYGEKLWKTEASANYKMHLLKHLSVHRDTRTVNYLNYLKALQI